MYALHEKPFMWTRTGLPVMVVMLCSTLDVPAWKPCQETALASLMQQGPFSFACYVSLILLGTEVTTTDFYPELKVQPF